ncbi:N-acetylmuramoyl-L-alanine amidase [Niallia sp. Krafla_26]|uniref:N-acetylmuramoyl-L-alanine amidase n=1 Tax=Niallia sp. Krafla_26 TaxID=3064703 RepID=UPI003D179E3E
MKLYLDPGHGGSDPGAVGNGLREKDITLDIALRIRNILVDEYDNIEIKMSRTGDTFPSLSQRTNEANSWKADFFLSIHCNAFNGSSRGYEDFIYSGLDDRSRSARIQDIMHEEIMKVNGLINRGQKKGNLHVLRESKMEAILTENGFIDNSSDANLMKQPSWREKVARGHVNGIVKAFNLPKKKGSSDGGRGTDSGSNTGTLFRVIAGSFQDLENAEERVARLRQSNIDAFVVEVQISGTTWYRVQAGAFSTRENADDRVKQIQGLGIDAFVMS